jgi:hypothetical protein
MSEEQENARRAMYLSDNSIGLSHSIIDSFMITFCQDSSKECGVDQSP